MEKGELYQPAQDCEENLQEQDCEENLKTQALQHQDVDCDDDDVILQPAPNEKRFRYKRIGRMTTKAVAYTAVMTALVYVGTIIGYSSQAFYFNLGDSIILICAALFNPICAMIAGGLGSFFGDLTVYPATMLFTLVIKAVEGLLAGFLFKFINRWFDKKSLSLIEEKQQKRAYILKIVFSCLASLLSVIVMMLGYFMCQSLFYGTVTSALVALPFDFAQGAISLAIANLALYVLKLDNFRTKLRI